MYKLPIKVTNYYEYYKDSYFYADKTKIIKYIIETKSKTLWFLRGSGMGKTVNMTMLYYFFDIQENFIVNSQYFIKKEPELLRYKNRYPVIHLDFTDTESVTFADTFYNFKRTIRCVYNNYPFIFSDKSDSLEYRIFNHKIYDLDAAEEDYLISVKRLIKKISQYYSSQVIIIVDGYDHLFLKSLELGFYSELKSFFLNFLQLSCDEDENIFKIIVAGIYKITDKPIFRNTLYSHFPTANDLFLLTRSEANIFSYNIYTTSEYETYTNKSIGDFYLNVNLAAPYLLVKALSPDILLPEKNIIINLIKQNPEMVATINQLLNNELIPLTDTYHILTYDELNNLNKNNFLTALINYGILGLTQVGDSANVCIPNESNKEILKYLMEEDYV